MFWRKRCGDISEVQYAIDLFEQNPHDYMIDWYNLSRNPNAEAIRFLEQNKEKIDWHMLSRNTGRSALSLLEKNPEKIEWDWLSMNPCAISLLEQNPEKIEWSHLSLNPCAVHLLEQNPHKIDWSLVSANTGEGIIHLLENNPEKIDWRMLSRNPAIITYDYIGMKTKMDVIREQLMMYIFHPKRFARYLDMGYDMGDDEYIEEI